MSELQNAGWIFDSGYNPTKSSFVKVNAIIKEVATGEVVVLETSCLWDVEEQRPNDFSWEGGNESCDCNRRHYFLAAKGLPRDDEVDCSEGKYLVNLQNPVTGQIFYRETEDA